MTVFREEAEVQPWISSPAEFGGADGEELFDHWLVTDQSLLLRKLDDCFQHLSIRPYTVRKWVLTK